jgi:membrane protein
LVPGAILFGAGIEALHVVIAYFIAPQAGSKQGTYGSLGIAAALLLGLFLISRLITATAILNAVLWSGRTDFPPQSRERVRND